MKQLVQNFKTGELQLVDIYDPLLRSGGVVLQTANSLISVSTEKPMVNLAQQNIIEKAMVRNA